MNDECLYVIAYVIIKVWYVYIVKYDKYQQQRTKILTITYSKSSLKASH